MLDLIVPAPNTTTPQKLHRRGAAKLWTRGRLDIYTPEQAELVTATHAARLAPDAPTPADLERTLIQHLGYQYGFWDRCGGTHHEHDCSGYQCWGMNQIVRPLGCLSSFVIAQLCFDAGLMISYEEAQTVPCWAFHGADNGRRDDGSRPNGASGHIVYVNNMPGYGLSTLEAMGHAYGVCRGAFYNRNWTGYYKILGLNYAPPAPPKPKVEPMFTPNKQLAARLRNPGGNGQVGGWWEAYDNGLVDFLGDDGSIVNGGMNSPDDVRNFAAHGEKVARLEPRTYGSPPKRGYTIVATDGHTYVPERQR